MCLSNGERKNCYHGGDYHGDGYQVCTERSGGGELVKYKFVHSKIAKRDKRMLICCESKR